MLVLHYTGMPDAQARSRGSPTLVRRCRAITSSTAKATIFTLVDEARRAWHAGQSSWHGQTDLNSRSIGIEIDHPGHDGGNPPFPEAQVDAVIELCRGILARWPIPPARVLAHSDIAPARKQDPGERFPWACLHRAGVGHLVPPAPVADGSGIGPGDRGAKVKDLQGALAEYGYAVEVTGSYGDETQKVVRAFQQHFRPERADEDRRCLDAYDVAQALGRAHASMSAST